MTPNCSKGWKMTYTYLLITVKFEPEAKFSADPMLAISLYGPKRKEDGKKIEEN